jgi:cell division initiation protein
MLSPIEIKKHEFGKSVRGYDVDEVRSFLETVADDVEKLTESTRSQATEIERLRAELEAYQRIDQNMKEALVNAQETLRGAKEGSQREAELEAERIIADARKRSDDLRREIETLALRRDAIVRKIKSILRSEMELIDILKEEDFSTDGASAAAK